MKPTVRCNTMLHIFKGVATSSLIQASTTGSLEPVATSSVITLLFSLLLRGIWTSRVCPTHPVFDTHVGNELCINIGLTIPQVWTSGACHYVLIRFYYPSGMQLQVWTSGALY